MSLPPGVQTVTLTFGPYVDHQGEPLGGTVVVTPLSTVDIVHLATGWGLVTRPYTAAFVPGAQGQMVLLATDQPGFNVINFAYSVEVRFDAGSGVANRAPRRIVLPAGVPVVDLELIDPAPGPVLTYAVPSVLSVGGFTGTVTIAQLQSAGLAPTTDASALTSGILAPARVGDASVSLVKLSATGTRDATTVLRGDGTWSVPPGGNVTASSISDSTTVGRAVLTAIDAAAARTATGLGTAATASTGTAAGQVPLLTTGGVLPKTELGTGTPAANAYVDGGTGAWTALPSGASGTTDASLLTSGILPAARIGDLSVADAKLASGTALAAAERTKLTGVATGATANRTDADTDTLLAAKAPLASPTFTGTVTVPAPTVAAAATTKTYVDGAVSTPRATTGQTGTAYTFVAADARTIVEFNNAGAVTVTIPADATTNFAIGTELELVQTGAGQVTVVGATGVTLVSRGSAFKLVGQWADAAIRKRAANSWILVGDVIA